MTTLSFSSWAQPAAAAAEVNIDPADATPDAPPPPPPRATLAPVVVIQNASTGAAPQEVGAITGISMLGPDGIVGLEPGQIIGRYPVPGSTGSEAINLAAAEFSSTDLPWRFSPATAGNAQRLRPWLVLIVVPIEIGIAPATPLPTMTVPVRYLPDLAESWAWAHVQLDDATTGRSRLLCPRKLPPNTTLRAAIVPAFLGGVRAGLGQRVVFGAADAYSPAWMIDQPEDAVLPVYDYWQFSTGNDADFEFLARRIKPARQQDLGDFGYRSVDINDAWLDDPLSAEAAVIPVNGALRPLNDPPAATATPAQLSSFATRITDAIAAGAAGKLEPPLRGGQHALRSTIAATGGDWLDEVNRDAAHRTIATQGAAWVSANQEQLMAQAWTQAGQIRAAAAKLALGRAALAITESLQTRHVDRLSPDELVTLTAPAATRARLGATTDEPTLHAAFNATAAPAGVTSTAMARLLRPAGAVGRAGATRSAVTRALAGTLTQATTTGYSTSKLAAVAQAKPTPAGVDNPATALTATTNIDTTASAAAAMWVAGKVAQRQNVNLPATFMHALGPAAVFSSGPTQLTPELTTFTVRTQVALAVTQDQLSSTLTVQPIPPPVQIHPDGLQVSAQAAANLVTSAFDCTTALRRRLTSSVLRGDAPLSNMDPVLPTVDVPVPLATALIEQAPEWFLPGIGDFPINRANLLTSDDAFIEAAMLGANVELLSEFLWREFPTDRRGTPIARFWPRPDSGADIRPIHLWTGAVGSNTTLDEGQTTFILIRAELFTRYPDTIVLAAAAEADPVHPNQLRPSAAPDAWLQPLLMVKIDASTRALAFPIPRTKIQAPVTPANAGWFFVLVEPPTALRFGFDLRTDPPAPQPGLPAPATWNDITWDHVIDDRGFARARTPLTLAPPQPPPAAQWGGPAACSADVARVALQRQVWVALHASTMISAGG